MRPIGWTIACLLLLLLAAGFSKCASTETTALNHGQVEATKLLPISKDTVDPDVPVISEFLDGLIDAGSDQGSRQARTFGVKRIQFMLMPMVYKMGVMMTMLTVLTVISLKGLLIGVALLVLKLSTIIAKFSSGWHQNTSQQQPIHVHVHNGLPMSHSQPYSGWMPQSGPDSDEHYYYRG